ncbi:extracellular solute-binding protein [Paenibacillus campinasensis]|uniref:ABC transporter substrate-binding protein n=1 Tax=Paenibacillus campinasensis TaxID=66347 RepID=A0A268F4C1_9BACL|nr:extracellular solute-binding protein [Paenibacillus campinasensis]MUG64475.1 extracellular solute-binding protein [Paenibacillus campinasensis]PAD80211.1 ABC transporter substrate-binding protein [Paenibacillus campinasensis]
MLGNTKRNGMAMVSVILAVLLLFTACSSNSNSNESGGSSGSESGQRVTLKIEVFDRGNSPAGSTITDNYLTRYVQENFGDPNNIDVEFVPVPRSEEVEKLNVLMASGSDVPDIVFTYDTNTFNRYASQGGLTDLAPLLEEHAPNLTAFLGEDILQYGLYEGTQYAVPAKRSQVGKYASFIRQDWLDKLGLDVPKTTEELYEVLKAFKEKDPGETGGQVIPLAMTVANAQYEPLIWSFIEPLTEEQSYTLTQTLGSNDYPTLLPGFKEALQFMNKLYNEGLMSRDFALDTDKKKLGEDVSSGKVGFFSEDDVNPFYENGMYATLQKNVPGATLAAVDVYLNPEGKYAKPMYNPNGMYIMVPKSSNRAVEAIKYLEWMATDDHLFHMQNGVEGENYTMVDDVPVAMENQTEEALNRLYNSGDMAIISNGKQLGSEELNLRARAMQFPKEYQDIVAIAQELANTDLIEPVVLSRPIDAQTKYGTTLQEKFKEMLVKTTMAKPDQFDNVYETMMKDYMASGGQAILDERTAVYQEMQSK